MGGGHVGNAVQQLRQVAGQVRVPGVAVDQVGVPDACRHRQVYRHRLECGREARLTAQRRPGLVGRRHQWGLARLTKAVHPHVDGAGQLPGQIFNVHTRSPVHLGWKLSS